LAAADFRFFAEKSLQKPKILEVSTRWRSSQSAYRKNSAA